MIERITEGDGNLTCPACAAGAVTLDFVDFNKSCEEAHGRFLPLAGIPVSYALCEGCGFCFAPELCKWTLEEFSARIYNDDYLRVDPDYLEARPRANADHLIALVGDASRQIRHLDYGGGHGLLSDLLRDAKWNSMSYDPFVDSDGELRGLGKFDLVTAYEVFEHVPEPRKLAANLAGLLRDDGVILFSTLVSDGNIAGGQRLTWWYASPRNGHISLFSKRSLFLLGQGVGFNFGSMSPNVHAYWKIVPAWAQHFIGFADPQPNGATVPLSVPGL
jgi:SAM-dependent methyltransferase